MFKNLQAKFDGKTEFPIEIQEICDALVEMGYQDEIRVVDEDMDTTELLGTYVKFTEPSGGMYSEPNLISLIVYPSNVAPLTQRIICAKELVHVCDSKVSKISDAEEIMELAQVLCGNVAVGEEPRMTMKVAADVLAQQKGLMLLFPKAARVISRQKVLSGEITIAELAGRLQLPENTVEDMLDEDWDIFADQIAQI
ncbi:MAG: hypothetical protein ACPG5U_06425 [Planktomarina sp.]